MRPQHLVTNVVPVVNLRNLELPPTTSGALAFGVNVTRALDAPTAGTDVYAVRQVQLEGVVVPHLLLGLAALGPAEDGLRWHAERYPPTETNPLGQVVLRLLDPAKKLAELRDRVFHLTVDVTNRSLPPEVRAVRDYQAETDSRVQATAVRLPTPVLHPRPDAGWGAITFPTLNSLALVVGGRRRSPALAAFALLDACENGPTSRPQATRTC